MCHSWAGRVAAETVWEGEKAASEAAVRGVPPDLLRTAFVAPPGEVARQARTVCSCSEGEEEEVYRWGLSMVEYSTAVEEEGYRLMPALHERHPWTAIEASVAFVEAREKSGRVLLQQFCHTCLSFCDLNSTTICSGCQLKRYSEGIYKYYRNAI